MNDIHVCVRSTRTRRVIIGESGPDITAELWVDPASDGRAPAAPGLGGGRVSGRQTSEWRGTWLATFWVAKLQSQHRNDSLVPADENSRSDNQTHPPDTPAFEPATVVTMDIKDLAANNPTPPPGFDPENAQNLEDMEKQFAVKVVQHMEIYFSILEKVKGSTVRLTKMDDEIYEHLQKDFPEFDPAEPIDEDKMKSPEGKKRWRDFMMQYEKKIDDYNFGTMVRASPKTEYTQEGTIFVPRMQFYAVEIARNRNGLNDWIYEEKQKEKAGKS
ncbi:uncharacterized protein JN550_013084 [Neoarthrinium moseri]|uniref:uncharacterized protein n=1 Tax=Neoarthrinium moseri TaxID=1658444 RepID=UPI001FDBEC91|nr:uncharacterized protein JN550_013084 [Neoarthrinium moseri]KAI1857748.1 hypothetical protein JN550_013084 [Neoarthrinium moseri]